MYRSLWSRMKKIYKFLCHCVFFLFFTLTLNNNRVDCVCYCWNCCGVGGEGKNEEKWNTDYMKCDFSQISSDKLFYAFPWYIFL